MSRFIDFLKESTVCAGFGFSEPGDVPTASTDMNSDEMKDIIGRPRKKRSHDTDIWKEDKKRQKKFGYFEKEI